VSCGHLIVSAFQSGANREPACWTLHVEGILRPRVPRGYANR